MLEFLQTAGGIILAIIGAIGAYFLLVFVLKNRGQIVRVVVVLGVILFAAVALGAFLGSLLDQKYDQEIFTICGASVFGLPALFLGGRFVVEKFIKGRDWFPED